MVDVKGDWTCKGSYCCKWLIFKEFLTSEGQGACPACPELVEGSKRSASMGELWHAPTQSKLIIPSIPTLAKLYGSTTSAGSAGICQCSSARVQWCKSAVVQ